MRILLIDPPFQRFMRFYRYYYPIGLAYLGAILAKLGHTVEIYDAEHSLETETTNWLQAAYSYSEYIVGLQNINHPIWQELKNKILVFNPDVIGISMLSVKVRSAYLVAKISKDINSNITIIVGADHPTIFPEEVLKNPDINYVVRGEGEITIKELISHLEDERRLPLDTIKGISYKKNGKIVHNPDRDLISDINSLPFPAIYLLNNLETYRPIDLGVILASRGCPYKCSFCGVSSIWTRRIRYRSLRNVFIEMKGLNANYGTDYFSFRDASFTLSRRRTILLCEKIIRENFRIQWECLTRADLIDEEVVTLMKKSGCTTIRIGIESGSEEILKDMNKSIDLDRVRSVAKLLNKYNFNWSAYFLFGTPRETRETISTTLKLIEEIDPPFVTIARYAPIPGTKMYNDLINAKLISPSIDWSFESNQRLKTNYVYSMSENEFEDVMRDVARYIEDRNRVNKFGVRDARLR